MSLVPYLEMTLSKLQVLSDLVSHQLEEMGQWRTFGDPKAWYRYFRMKSFILYHWMILNDLEGWIILTPAHTRFFRLRTLGPEGTIFLEARIRGKMVRSYTTEMSWVYIHACMHAFIHTVYIWYIVISYPHKTHFCLVLSIMVFFPPASSCPENAGTMNPSDRNRPIVSQREWNHPTRNCSVGWAGNRNPYKNHLKSSKWTNQYPGPKAGRPQNPMV